MRLYPSAATSWIFYTHVDYGGCLVIGRSTFDFDYCMFLSDNLLSWSFKHQLSLSRPVFEAEYHGVTKVVLKSCWFASRSYSQSYYCDIVNAIYLNGNSFQHQQIKHIDIHFVQKRKPNCNAYISCANDNKKKLEL